MFIPPFSFTPKKMRPMFASKLASVSTTPGMKPCSGDRKSGIWLPLHTCDNQAVRHITEEQGNLQNLFRMYSERVGARGLHQKLLAPGHDEI